MVILFAWIASLSVPKMMLFVIFIILKLKKKNQEIKLTNLNHKIYQKSHKM